MNFFSYHRLPLYQAPDVNPAPPADPAIVANADPAAADPAPAATDPPPPAADPVDPPAANADPAADPTKPHGNKGAKPWFLARISEESERARLAEERAAAAEELAQRLQRGAADPAAQAVPSTLTDAEVEARAQQIVARQQIGNVISEGIAAFPDWDDRAAILGSAGAASPEFVMDVIGVDPKNAHKLLYQLADDPAKAARIAKMDPRTRTIELVKMSMAANPQSAEPAKPAAPPKTVSKAPAPPPAIEPGTAQGVDWRSDKVSDAEFSKGWEENMKKRAQRR